MRKYLFVQSTNIKALIMWLVLRAVKTKQILCFDWPPEQPRWAYLVRSGFPASVPQGKRSLGHMNEFFHYQVCLVNMDEYWHFLYLRFY